MAAISQTTFSSAFPWLKLLYFNHNCNEICSLGSNWHYGSNGSDNGLAPNRRQAIIWTSNGLGYWRIYVSLGLNDLNMSPQHAGHTWTNADSLSISPGAETTNEVWVNIHMISFKELIKKCLLRNAAILCRPQWLYHYTNILSMFQPEYFSTCLTVIKSREMVVGI